MLQVDYPMQTMGKCRVVKGSIEAVRPGMGVFRGRGPQRSKPRRSRARCGDRRHIIRARTGGEFLMGSPEGDGTGSEHPQHRVAWTVSSSGHEVSQEAVQGGHERQPQYFIGENLPLKKSPGTRRWNSAGASEPVTALRPGCPTRRSGNMPAARAPRPGITGGRNSISDTAGTNRTRPAKLSYVRDGTQQPGAV